MGSLIGLLAINPPAPIAGPASARRVTPEFGAKLLLVPQQRVEHSEVGFGESSCGGLELQCGDERFVARSGEVLAGDEELLLGIEHIEIVGFCLHESIRL